MKKLKTILLCALVLSISLCSLGKSNRMEKIAEKSSSLDSFQAKIAMRKFRDKGDSDIKLKIKFLYPDQMKIEYMKPDRVKGQLIIVNENRFYSYIPTLDREINKKAGEGSNETGKEMGFFYKFLTRSVDNFLENHKLESLEGPKTRTIETDNKSKQYEIYQGEFTKGNSSQVVQFTADTHIPVFVKILKDDEKRILLKILSHEYNPSIPSTEFKIPPKE